MSRALILTLVLSTVTAFLLKELLPRRARFLQINLLWLSAWLPIATFMPPILQKLQRLQRDSSARARALAVLLCFAVGALHLLNQRSLSGLYPRLHQSATGLELLLLWGALLLVFSGAGLGLRRRLRVGLAVFTASAPFAPQLITLQLAPMLHEV